MFYEGVKLALEANRAAYDALRAGLKIGITEHDAYGIVATAVNSVCGDDSHEFIGDFVGGARTGSIEGAPTDYVFREGDVFICDLSVRRGEWWSDTCRTFFFGEPTAEQRRAYETVLAMQSYAASFVKAGIVCEDVKIKVERRLSELGYGGKMPHHVGHRVGPKPYMKPAFEMGDSTRLEVNTICTLEPGIYFKGEWGIRVENDYFVTDEKIINLFEYPTRLEEFIV